MAIVGWVLTLLIGGCYPGDPTALRAIVVEFPASRHVSAADPDVQKALRIIDETFVANGFTRDKGPLAAEDRASGIIATYNGYPISIEGHSLIVGFNEFGRSRSSPTVRETCALMKEKLSEKVGGVRVTVETNVR